MPVKPGKKSGIAIGWRPVADGPIRGRRAEPGLCPSETMNVEEKVVDMVFFFSFFLFYRFFLLGFRERVGAVSGRGGRHDAFFLVCFIFFFSFFFLFSFLFFFSFSHYSSFVVGFFLCLLANETSEKHNKKEMKTNEKETRAPVADFLAVPHRLVLHRHAMLYRVLLGFTGFYWVLLGFTGFYLVLPSFT